jgi:DNA gyrase subunit A
VREDSDVMIITAFGKIIRVHANEIREAGRSTQGVRLLRLDDEDKIAAAAILEEEAAAGDGNGAAPGAPSAGTKEKEPEKS